MKYLISLFLFVIPSMAYGSIAIDINIPVKKSNATTAVTQSTTSTSNNELVVMLMTGNTSTPKLPSDTAGLTFTTATVVTNAGWAAAWVACSGASTFTGTFTGNSAAASGKTMQVMSFTGTGCSPANPLGGIGAFSSSIAASGTGTTLLCQYNSTVANSQGYSGGEDASNGETLTVSSNETLDTLYSSDTFSSHTGFISHQTTTTSTPGTVVVSSAAPVTSFGSSLAMICIEILPTTVPIVTTLRLTNITQTTSTGNGIVFSGGASLTDAGVCWNTTGNPTTSDTCVSEGTTEGTFNVSLTGFTAGNIYHARAYGTNSLGTTYGNDAWFQTSVSSKIGHNTGSGNLSTILGSGNITAH